MTVTFVSNEILTCFGVTHMQAKIMLRDLGGHIFWEPGAEETSDKLINWSDITFHQMGIRSNRTWAFQGFPARTRGCWKLPYLTACFMLLPVFQARPFSNEPLLTCHLRKKNSDVTNNINNGSALFTCPSKSWQWVSKHSTRTLKVRLN